MRVTAANFFSRALLAAILAGRAAHAAPVDDDHPPATADYVSRSWTTDHGLPHNVVTRIQQDKIGYLWLATMAGLARFDGREFKVFPLPERSAGGGRNIRDLAILEDGTVLFLPATGGIFQLKDGIISVHPLSHELDSEPLLELYVEPGGAIWVGTGSSLVRWDHGRTIRFGAADGINRRLRRFSWATDAAQRTWIGGADFLGYYREGKLVKINDAPGTVYTVASARSGGVWVFGTGLQKWENEKLTPVAGVPWPAGRTSVRCLFEDRMGMLWVATSHEGVFRFDGQHFDALPNVEPAADFVTEDREGNIWLATNGGGIRRLRPKVFTWIDTPATSVCEDGSGGIWFAADADGVVRRTGGTQEAHPFSGSHNPLHISSVCADLRGNLWMGSVTGIYRTSAGDPESARRMEPDLRNVRLLFCTRAGDIWVEAASVIGFFHGDVFTRLPRDAIGAGEQLTTIAENPAGHLWFGTSRGNLYEFAGGALTRSTVSPEVGNGTIHAILPDVSGALWLATTEGLVLVDHGQRRCFTQADGLPDEIILQLLDDDLGNLWLATPHGLFRISRTQLLALAAGRASRLDVVAYGPEQGLHGISPTTNHQPAACKDSRGCLWFCTYKGAIGIEPARLPSAELAPPVLIDEVRLDDRPLDHRGEMQIPPGGERLEFQFAALSFAAPERVQVRHRLEGFDAGWIDTPPDRCARYAKLPPGKYRLRVIACSSEGVWNREGATYAFTVLPAWWQTAWSRGVSVCAFAGLIGWGVRFWSKRQLRTQFERLEHEHALDKERARIARDMHDDLGSSVTGMNLLVQRLRDHRESEIGGIVELLDRRVRRLTLELERIVWTVSPKNSSLDRLAVFIERFAQNLFADSRILCRVQGRDTIPPLPLTPEWQHHVLAVTKEAINNVLKHSSATETTIAMSFRDNVLALSIRDDGAGFQPESQALSERNGLRNMQARVAEVGGTLIIRSAPGAGTEISLQLPMGRSASA